MQIQTIRWGTGGFMGPMSIFHRKSFVRKYARVQMPGKRSNFDWARAYRGGTSIFPCHEEGLGLSKGNGCDLEATCYSVQTSGEWTVQVSDQKDRHRKKRRCAHDWSGGRYSDKISSVSCSLHAHIDQVREDTNRKRMFSFGHCSNHLTTRHPPPTPNGVPHPPIWTTWSSYSGGQKQRFACMTDKNSDDDNDGCSDNYNYDTNFDDNGDKKDFLLKQNLHVWWRWGWLKMSKKESLVGLLKIVQPLSTTNCYRTGK